LCRHHGGQQAPSGTRTARAVDYRDRPGCRSHLSTGPAFRTVRHLLFVPFGIYQASDVRRPRSEFLGEGIDLAIDRVRQVDPKNQRVETEKGTFAYDKLVVSTGVDLAPEEIEGMSEGWQGVVFDFYTLPGAENLASALREFDEGRIVLDVAEVPYKCPVAPMEFVCLLDWYFAQRGIRDKVQIELVTPLSTCLNFPIAGTYLTELAHAKNIDTTFRFTLESVDRKRRTIRSFKGDIVNFDLLVSIPPNVGAEALIDSGIADADGLVKTNKHTLKAMHFDKPQMSMAGKVRNRSVH
jgi:sulfide:quinone oxidoreductase